MMVKSKKTVVAAAICLAVTSVGFVENVNASAPPPKRPKGMPSLIYENFI